MAEPRKYRLLKDRFEHAAGVTVYEYQGYDYRLSRDDTEYFGQEHISVTLDPKGEGTPFFTVPVKDLEAL